MPPRRRRSSGDGTSFVFLPKVLGVLIQVGGLCYTTNGFALFLAPTVADRMFPAILVPAFVGEASLCLWLLVRGVNVDRWKQASGQSARDAAATVQA